MKNNTPSLIAMNQYGFTLMETMVATMVLGIALVAVMELFAGGLRSARLAEDHTRAVLLADEKLTEIILTAPKEETTLEGTLDDQFHWSCSIMPLADDSPDTYRPLLQSIQYSLTVSWQHGKKTRNYSLSTIRIAPPPIEQESI